MDLLHGLPRFEHLTCTFQKEVGERLAGRPRTEAYGPVSVITQTLAKIRPIAIIPPSAFWPRPQIESIMLAVRPLPVEQVEVTDIPAFIALVQRAFQQRRKMIRRLLRDLEEVAAMAVLFSGLASVRMRGRKSCRRMIGACFFRVLQESGAC